MPVPHERGHLLDDIIPSHPVMVPDRRTNGKLWRMKRGQQGRQSNVQDQTFSPNVGTECTP